MPTIKIHHLIVCMGVSCAVLAPILNTPAYAIEWTGPNAKADEQIEELEQRLNHLEPREPQQIIKFPYQLEQEEHYPSHAVPISDVIHKGTQIPFKVIVNKPEYQRPIYEKHWHSTYGGGRWSYMPNRIYYALHRLFTSYDIGLSEQYNFQHDVGISFPTFQNETDLDLYLVVFGTDVKEIYTAGNQIIVVGKPKRNGAEVITIKTSRVHPTNKNEMLLVQLATKEGDEIDYSLIAYVQPDFWSKQKAKLNQ